MIRDSYRGSLCCTHVLCCVMVTQICCNMYLLCTVYNYWENKSLHSMEKNRMSDLVFKYFDTDDFHQVVPDNLSFEWT